MNVIPPNARRSDCSNHPRFVPFRTRFMRAKPNTVQKNCPYTWLNINICEFGDLTGAMGDGRVSAGLTIARSKPCPGLRLQDPFPTGRASANATGAGARAHPFGPSTN